MADFPVRPEKLKQLMERFARLGIREEDIEERFVRASGRGGQKVNKTSSCVMLVHRPTGVRVRSEEERSQALNRFKARRLLADKLEEMIVGELRARVAEVERKRRQKRRRSRRSKEKMLAAKHRRSERLADRKVEAE